MDKNVSNYKVQLQYPSCSVGYNFYLQLLSQLVYILTGGNIKGISNVSKMPEDLSKHLLVA